MPTYTYRNTETGEVFDRFLKISEHEQYKKDNPHLETILHPYNIVSGVSVTNKESDGFKEVMSKVAENHPGSEVAKRYGRKDAKSAKTEAVLKKHGVL